MYWKNAKKHPEAFEAKLKEHKLTDNDFIFLSTIRVNNGEPMDNEGMWGWHFECMVTNTLSNYMIIRLGDDFSDYVVRWRRENPAVNSEKVIFPICLDHFDAVLNHLVYRTGLFRYMSNRGLSEYEAYECFHDQLGSRDLPSYRSIAKGENYEIKLSGENLAPKLTPELAIAMAIEWEVPNDLKRN